MLHKWHGNTNTPEMEAEGSEVQGHSQLHSKVEASLGYMIPKVKRIVYPRHNPLTFCLFVFPLFVVLGIKPRA